MNIGIFSDCYLPTKNGVTTAILTAKTELERRGHKVVIVTVAMPGIEDDEPSTYRVPFMALSLGC